MQLPKRGKGRSHSIETRKKTIAATHEIPYGRSLLGKATGDAILVEKNRTRERVERSSRTS